MDKHRQRPRLVVITAPAQVHEIAIGQFQSFAA